MVVERWRTILMRSIGDTVSKTKKSGKKPDFIGLTDWNTMMDLWEEAENVKKSKQNTENATSNPDGMGKHVHISGSTSHSRIRYEMEIELGAQPAATAVVCKTHARKDGTVIDKRVEALVAAAESLALERSHGSDLIDGTSSTLQLTAAYVEKAMNAKGRIYGLGSIQYLDPHPNESAAASLIRKAAAEEEVAELNETVSELKQGMKILLSINGVDPKTYQPQVPRESGASIAPNPSPHSEFSK